MEKLLATFKVDVAVWAHEHVYERLWPIYNYTILKGSEDKPYVNPKGPVHLTTGSAVGSEAQVLILSVILHFILVLKGCKENHDGFLDQPKWSAFRSADYGYTMMKILSKEELQFSQISDDQDGKVIDEITITKNKNQEWLAN